MPIDQAQAIITAANTVESTMLPASQASAARFIYLLREAYPEINTSVLTYVDATNTSATNAAQEGLHEYLEKHIAQLDNPSTGVISLPSAYNPSIDATLRMIDTIAADKAHSQQDIKRVLLQMLSIATTCPGFTWSPNDKFLSTNAVYDSTLKTMKFVTASPAETLNLLCRALLDSSRYPEDSSSFF